MTDTQPARELTITHTYADGTTLDGTRREDDLYRLLRSHGWLYRRSVGDFRLQGSVDKPAKAGKIEYTAQALRDRGFTVTVDVDNTMQSMEQAEADRAARADDRAARLENRAGRIASEAAARRKRADDVFDNIPAGQPMLVDHYSYKADRKRRERAWNNLGKSIELAGKAERVAAAADTASRNMDHRYSPLRVANRIQKLEADLRTIERRIAGRKQWVREVDGSDVFRHVAPTGEALERSQAEKAHTERDLAHWRGVRAHQIAAGQATNYSKETVDKGDLVLTSNRWYRVVRANGKSVSVPSLVGGGNYATTVEYEKLTDCVKPGDERWAKAAVDAVALAHLMSNGNALHKVYDSIVTPDTV